MARNIDYTHNLTRLERGGQINTDTIRARLYGQKDAPLIIVLGGISANRFVADGGRFNRGWWSPLVHKGGAIDLTRFQVLGYDYASIQHPPNPNNPYAITTADQAQRLNLILEHMQIDKVAACIGASYGGMVGLKFAQQYPDKLERLCVISAAHKPYPIGVAWRGIQRRIVRLANASGQARHGLTLARELAMTTYRTAEEFANRFSLQESATEPSRFDICDYLNARGQAFATHMQTEHFLSLSESVDLHQCIPEKITTPTLLMSAISDQIAPIADMRELRDRLAGKAELFTFTSLYGHDAFLKEYDIISVRLKTFCKDIKHA